MRSSRIAVVGCSQLVTLSGPGRPRTGADLRDLAVIEDGAFLAEEGRIVRTGTRAALERLMSPDTEVIEAGGRVVMPGFIDAHTHAIFAGNRAGEFEQRCAGATYQDIAASGGGIRNTVEKTRAMPENGLLAAARKHARWFLRNGTTTIEIKSGYGLSVEDELKILRAARRLDTVRTVPTFLGAHTVPAEYRDRRSRYVDLIIEEMLPRVAHDRLAEYCDVFCEQGAFSIDESRRVLSKARHLGFGLRIHADQLTNSGAAQLAAEMHAATADHLEQVDAWGIAALRAANVQPVLLPGAVYALGSTRYPPARAMIDAGLAPVLATDFNPGSSPTPSMPMIFSIACTQMKMLPSEAITAGTINAAYSVGRGHAAGSLEPGKQADFVILDCEDYRELCYFFGIELVERVYVGGRLAFARN